MLIDNFDLGSEGLISNLTREARITYKFPNPPKYASCRRLQRSIGSISLMGDRVVIRYIVSSEEKKNAARQLYDNPDYSRKDLHMYEAEDDVLIEILKRISSIPSTVVEPVELCENTMKFAFRFHVSDTAGISRCLMDISEKHSDVALGYIGDSSSLINTLGRISRYCIFTIYRFRIDHNLDEAVRLAAGKGSWERYHKNIYSNGYLGAIYHFSKQVPDQLTDTLKPISVSDRLFTGVINNPIIKKFHELSERYEIIRLGTIDEYSGKQQQLYVLSPSRVSNTINRIVDDINSEIGDGSIEHLPPVALIDAVGVAAVKSQRNNGLL
ncbi:MAG: hypothetical protein ACP5NK_01015 [Thermoplasmata archaeon]